MLRGISSRADAAHVDDGQRSLFHLGRGLAFDEPQPEPQAIDVEEHRHDLEQQQVANQCDHRHPRGLQRKKAVKTRTARVYTDPLNEEDEEQARHQHCEGLYRRLPQDDVPN